ncbi:hypothetical protein [Synechococcus sp. UW105]|jgi:hypothetical protein|uniref:hypothetical protein n=1 Tax=unclassified Synechococcus TaxID=2626047 RepID=UPI001483926A|nr:hypothetical protein [Synechococcus sp. UW105]|tara:strand:- start:107 stop:271 length:165 start_codon:yes stop_codon:yes gene_type:complete
MADHNSKHFQLIKLEDSWMLKTSHVIKDQDGDWLLSRTELQELMALLESASDDI